MASFHPLVEHSAVVVVALAVAVTIAVAIGRLGVAVVPLPTVPLLRTVPSIVDVAGAAAGRRPALVQYYTFQINCFLPVTTGNPPLVEGNPSPF